MTLSYKSKQFCKGAPGRFVYTGELAAPASVGRWWVLRLSGSLLGWVSGDTVGEVQVRREDHWHAVEFYQVHTSICILDSS